MSAGGLESASQHTYKRLHLVEQACDPSAGEMGTGGSFGSRVDSLACLVSLGEKNQNRKMSSVNT